MIWELLFLFFCFFSWWYVPMLICHGHPLPYIILVIVPYTYYSVYNKAERNGSRQWGWLRGLLIWRKARLYFPLDITVQDRAAVEHSLADNTCVFAAHPHGVFNWSVVLTFMFHGGITLLNKKETRSLVYVSVPHHLFYIPIVRDLLLWAGCVDELYVFELLETRRRDLNSKIHLVISPGRDVERLVCDSSRVGYTSVHNENTKQIKKALALGFYVIPVFCKGEDFLYRNLASVKRFRLHSYFQRTTEVCGRPIPNLAFGLYYSPLPLKHSLNICIGFPILARQEDLAPKSEKDKQNRKLYIKNLSLMFYSSLADLHSAYCPTSILKYSRKEV
jgi:diacylglycerol acyltransferase